MRHSLLDRFRGALFGSLLVHDSKKPLSRSYVELSETLITTGKFSPTPDILDCNNTAQLALSLLPVFLFFHENLTLLKQELEPLRTVFPNLDEVLLWGEAMSGIVAEKYQPDTLLEQILPHYPHTELAQQLELIQSFLRKNAGLCQVVSCLNRFNQPIPTALALSLYCFVYTPDAFPLCVNRAGNTGKFAPLTTPLTAALAGSYNSFIAIPVSERLALKKNPQSQQLHETIQQLFLAWSGVYQPTLGTHLSFEALASPGVIQPRPSLRVISQKYD